jgi:tRNA-splicing ligase RtcB (3'-phosphate/5'-hydroxy nucleic acid ligase)
MLDRAGDYEWRGEGERAELVLYAPDEQVARAALGRVLHITALPGVKSPVCAAASPEGLGWVAVSPSHAAPDLASVPLRGLLLVADASPADLGALPREVARMISRRLSETSLPRLSVAGTRRVCEGGALAAAEDGLLEEEDLALLEPRDADADALGRRVLSAGERDWESPADVRALAVGEVLDAAAGDLGLERGRLVLVISAGAGDLGRLALAGHRQRISSRARSGDFGSGEALPAAPASTGEAADLLAAAGAAHNFADGRAALLVYALRRALGDVARVLGLRAAWRVGGIEERDGLFAHRRDLASSGAGEVLVTGGSVVAGTGRMNGSVPPFGAPEDDGRPWEKAGVLEPLADLHPVEGSG